MRLKKIKLAGFKSFVDPTSIPFPDDMTAVVGPNGCGKSNVIDAVRWVLGESSAKNLRGDAMTDVIFNGSSARKPVSQCSVELVFDNSSGRIQGEYANYAELSVKRLVTREAQSTYFLNGSKCRRRDVTDLFLGTGLGPRSYAIIEQGMISRLIESKPQELRVFIEEAAGISKYKERRRETEHRIRHTKENLERLEDVRGELGQQLEKLQRQASAAKRYKELKAKERTLKAELAAIRWLNHSERIQALEDSIAQQQTDIESFVAQQRGDEKGITQYKEQQQDLKQQLEDIQRQYFSLGTEITRLEQNQIHSKQRRQQIEREQHELASKLHQAQSQQQHEAQQIELLQQQIESLEPEQEMLQASLVQAEQQLQEAEQALHSQQSQWRQQEQAYNQLKHQVQTGHSKIQSVMSMQMRTQQRITELEQEQHELEHDLLAEQILTLEEQLDVAKEQCEQARLLNEDAQEAQELTHSKHRQREQALLQAQGAVQRNQAQISALESVQALQGEQQNLADKLSAQGLSATPLWQFLEVAPKWEKAFDTVFDGWQGAQVLSELASLAELDPLLTEIPGSRLWFSSAMTSHKPQGTLASCIQTEQVPLWLSNVFLADNLQQAERRRSQLEAGQSVICADGSWLGRDWLINGCQEQQAGVHARANQLKTLKTDAEQLHRQLEQAEQWLIQATAQQEQARQTWQQQEAGLKQAEQAFNQQHNQLNLLQMQYQQSQTRQQKLQQDLVHQRQLLLEEQQQLEELSEQLEEYELALAEQEELQHDLVAHREQAQQKVSDARLSLDQCRSQNHQLALQLQGLSNQYHSAQQAKLRSDEQLQAMLERQLLLAEEAEQLDMPLQEQAEHLEILLQQRLQVEQQQKHTSDNLTEVAQVLAEVEKGHQGAIHKIQQLRTALESTRLECEGYRVRANAVLEHLEELQQPLKPILDNLSEQAEEKPWQQELEKTIAAISRLGAVNLAAVEEFEVQAQRKQHLDDQNDDLTAAMETLESAIRKIDRETRSRFKDTFEKVNNDLKILFPKVFGGGSAYLDLTDDDLLETGVTIMARPPGKKNSTIHLLSGGEKALTALSLVFAIFRLNPAPFCLLDEVDAPLDDANVGRFCKLVSEMSKTVQFIFITHNKIAMEMASHLTGVTMAEPGVSRMVAVDVDEAVAFAQA